MGSILARVASTPFLPERDIPDLSGKVIIVTGGNTGIGYETVKQLLLKNAKVYLAARSADKATSAIKRLEDETKKSAIFLQLDLADLQSVRRAAEDFLGQEERLDVLFNNGGVMICPPDMLTKQNYDLQFGTNALGPFFFTELLLPGLKKSYAATGVPARIINTSSIGHQFAPEDGIEWSTIKSGVERDKWVKKSGSIMGPWKLYGASKLALMYASNYWSTTHAGEGIISCSLHPGGIKTELSRHTAGWFQALGNFMAYPAPMGAYTQLWAGTTAKPEEVNGKYLVPWGKVGKPDKRVYNAKLQKEVVEFLYAQIRTF
ncbi:hypothetical protein FB45DRAFT_920215 [Roridomyces roridus]|uniref:NAD(P)-binding protein n=1 Tax=Roridomyces roridus TaxID=1738132 RepID=A0AAD7FM56_9AGAR|nr:hypothetical protein FB45DRAFT_920215 [Roridomyces roridus]